MAVRRILFLFILLISSACAVVRSDSISKIALLAPFEGRYREIGYNALYAVRLAIADSAVKDLFLLAVDDGGSEESARARIKALNIDPDVKAVLVLGPFSSLESVQAISEKSILIIGSWGAQANSDLAYMLANADIGTEITPASPTTLTLADLHGPIITSELFALEQIPDLYADLSQITIVSSASLPALDFRERYISSDLYVPEPNLLATLSYDAAGLLIQSISSQIPIADIRYEGINGVIHFEDHYWQNAPIYHYHYVDKKLMLIQTD